jgi:hypothetical protein
VCDSTIQEKVNSFQTWNSTSLSGFEPLSRMPYGLWLWLGNDGGAVGLEQLALERVCVTQ